jgi:HlyD family secretion protein
MGTPLVEIGDPSDLEVIVEVLSRDGAVIPPGARVEFEQWGGPQPLIGRVRLVEPAGFTKISALGVEEQRVNGGAELGTPPEERATVGDNFRVEARIIVWEEEQVLKVPVGACFAAARAGGHSCWRTPARLRTVKVGRSSGIETQVLDGLQEGEAVILYPGNRVRDGQRVRPISV